MPEILMPPPILVYLIPTTPQLHFSHTSSPFEPDPHPVFILLKLPTLQTVHFRSTAVRCVDSPFFHSRSTPGLLPLCPPFFPERDPELGARKSQLKHDRHDAVVADTERTRSLLLQGSTRVVLTAMASNTCLAAIKLFAAISTNSASMFAESIHSIADLLNECLLFFGVMRASREPDSLHPYGFSRERYAWSLLSGCGIFFLGGGVSMYHGVSGMLNPVACENIQLALIVLGASTVLEGGTAYVALNQVKIAASEVGMSVLEYVKKGADPTAVQILLEDIAAISGVSIATVALSLAWYTGNPIYDAIGSTMIGGLLGCTAIFLIKRNISMLVETSMPVKRERQVVVTLLSDAVVKSVHDVKSTSIGVDGARFKAEVQFDGRLVASRASRDKDWVRELLLVQAMTNPDQFRHYLESHGESTIAQLAEEVDRLEIRIKKTVPEVKHIDLEIL